MHITWIYEKYKDAEKSWYIKIHVSPCKHIYVIYVHIHAWMYAKVYTGRYIWTHTWTNTNTYPPKNTHTHS